MEWDLYLDESGQFQKAGEPTLIGGVLFPHEQNPSEKDFDSWSQTLRNRLAESGMLTSEDLSRGDKLHLYTQREKRKRLDAEGKTELEELRESRYYIFDHCSENGGSPFRRKAQPWVLREYLSLTEAAQAKPVLFMNPDGVYHVDSNTTFMTIFANGIVRLYNRLREQNPSEPVKLYIHAAARDNITKRLEPDLFAVSPMAGIESDHNLGRQLYLNQIRNFVFLNGGSDLLDLKSFQDSLNSFEILNDISSGGDWLPNPATVVCDYICNSALASGRIREYQKILSEAGALSFDVFGEPLALADAQIELIEQKHDWLFWLKRLISNSFPVQETEEFFGRMNVDRGYNQNKCVEGLVDYLYPFVENREDMPGMVDRLWMIIEKCEPFKADAYALLKANLLIYLFALYTHLGKEKELRETEKAFVLCISGIRDWTIRDELMILFCNRKIVTDTDAFRYEEAEQWFEAAREHEESAIRNSNGLMTDFTLLIDKNEEPTEAVSVQYGKTIGSYLQLLTKAIRNAAGKKQKLLEEKAVWTLDHAFEHFSLLRDILRAHQNVCDLQVELGHYDEAMKHLYQSVVPGTAEDFREQAEAVQGVMGQYGKDNCFACLHYTYMMHRLFRKGSPYAEIMMREMLKTSPSLELLDHLLHKPHPEGVVAWHLGASLLYHGGYQQISRTVLESAIRSLSSAGSEVFATLGMAVQADLLAFGLEGKAGGDLKTWEQAAERFVKKRYPIYAEKVTNNPFREWIRDKGDRPDAEYLHGFADLVVY